MKTIIASQRLVRGQSAGDVREVLNAAWGHFFWQFGWGLWPAPLRVPPGALIASLRPNAVLLTGGNDLSRVSDDPLSAIRDSWEREWLACALERKLPVIGVCRGMQLIVTEAGGDIERVEGQSGRSHALHATGERVSRIDQGCFEREAVNSFHHYAVNRLPAEVVPLACDAHGYIEACIDLRHDRLGIMWHPERLQVIDERDVRLFRGFLGDAP